MLKKLEMKYLYSIINQNVQVLFFLIIGIFLTQSSDWYHTLVSTNSEKSIFDFIQM